MRRLKEQIHEIPNVVCAVLPKIVMEATLHKYIVILRPHPPSTAPTFTEWYY